MLSTQAGTDIKLTPEIEVPSIPMEITYQGEEFPPLKYSWWEFFFLKAKEINTKRKIYSIIAKNTPTTMFLSYF